MGIFKRKSKNVSARENMWIRARTDRALFAELFRSGREYYAPWHICANGDWRDMYRVLYLALSTHELMTQGGKDSKPHPKLRAHFELLFEITESSLFEFVGNPSAVDLADLRTEFVKSLARLQELNTEAWRQEQAFNNPAERFQSLIHNAEKTIADNPLNLL